MLLRLTTVALYLATISCALPTTVESRDVVLREASPDPEEMPGMSEALEYVKPRDAKAGIYPVMMSESQDYVKPRDAKAKAELEPELEMMPESLDYVKPRDAKAKAEPEPEMTMMSESLDSVKVAA